MIINRPANPDDGATGQDPVAAFSAMRASGLGARTTGAANPHDALASWRFNPSAVLAPLASWRFNLFSTQRK
jgi:hypothetical protein